MAKFRFAQPFSLYFSLVQVGEMKSRLCHQQPHKISLHLAAHPGAAWWRWVKTCAAEDAKGLMLPC